MTSRGEPTTRSNAASAPLTAPSTRPRSRSVATANALCQNPAATLQEIDPHASREGRSRNPPSIEDASLSDDRPGRRPPKHRSFRREPVPLIVSPRDQIDTSPTCCRPHDVASHREHPGLPAILEHDSRVHRLRTLQPQNQPRRAFTPTLLADANDTRRTPPAIGRLHCERRSALHTARSRSLREQDALPLPNHDARRLTLNENAQRPQRESFDGTTCPQSGVPAPRPSTQRPQSRTHAPQNSPRTFEPRAALSTLSANVREGLFALASKGSSVRLPAQLETEVPTVS